MKKCCFNENLDRMSYLPDAIQSHIVSFLPMKDAMRTSILSKQWKNICSSLSQLEFNQYDFNNKENTAAVFKDFVDKMVIRHDGSDIKSFSIITILDDIFILSRRVSTWISFAIQHNVQDLKLWIQYGELEKLPCEFFTCSTIRVLNLANIHIDWPKIIRFPLLKSLYIASLTFNNDNTVDKLFSSSACPMLEDLEIQACRVNAHTLSICNPSLKSIYIFDADTLNINISASTLWKLDCIWCEPPNITSETLSSLCNGYFDFYNRGSCTAAMITSQFNCVSKILMGLRNVETLNLSSSFILFLSRGRALLPASLPSSYCSLKHLNLQLFPTSIHVQLMKLLLRSYPNLQNLQICIDRKEYNWHLETLTSMDVTDHVEENWQLKELPLGDMLNCLRIVEIKDFEGSESEVSLVRYLLENAKFLEKMNINYENSIQQSAGSHTPKSEMLSTFARVASNATILLS